MMFAFVAALSIWSAGAAATPQMPPEPQSVAPPADVVRWLRKNAVAIGQLDQPPGAAEARTLHNITRGARVIAFGESGHGNEEPLTYRNRLIRYLVAHEGLTAVALESGLAESRPLYEYVLGGNGDAASLTRTGLTHGFGQIEKNVELVQWLREWNAAHPRRPVHFYGIDHSTIQSARPGTKGFGIALDRLSEYLRATIPSESADVRGRLARFSHRFNEVDYQSYSPEDKAAIAGVLADTKRLFTAHRESMIRATSAEAYDWAAREAYDAGELPEVFSTWTDDPFKLDTLTRLIELRDLAMARNTEWALNREGPNGRVFLFQANGHVTDYQLVGSVMRLFSRQPLVSGAILRHDLGAAYKAIATISSRGRPGSDATLGSVDRAFAAAGRSPVLLDLASQGRSPWWSARQTASQGDARVDDLIPSRAFDGMLYFDKLTPLPPPK